MTDDLTITRPEGGGITLDSSAELWIARLRLVYGEGLDAADPRLGQFVDLVDAPLTLGRAPTAPGHFHLPGDRWASRQHCRLIADGDDVEVEDLGSRNGVYVNGAQIQARAHLHPDDVLRVGGSVFVVSRVPMQRSAEIMALSPPPPAFSAWSWAALRVWGEVQRVASANDGVLILGEMGTGKTRLARHLHALSQRDGPFEACNCSAIPINLEEATLFGVVDKFIPGVRAREGLLTRAARGTLFLDELADLPTAAQAKLLDAFDPTAPSYLPVGATQRLTTRCRLISATNRDVFALASQGIVRQDLLSRLATIQITVPPLRERREDILRIFGGMLERRGMAQQPIVNAELAEALLLAPWTENVRGLESLAVRVALGEALTVKLVGAHAGRGAEPVAAPSEVEPPTPPPPAKVRSVLIPEKVVWPPTPAEILEVLEQTGWTLKDAARRLGKRDATLSRFLKKTFGGLSAAKKAGRVWKATGRIPRPDQVDAAFALVQATPTAAALRAQRRWARDGELEPS